jgi:hypothetical protein
MIRVRTLLLASLAMCCALKAIDNPHFYRATYFYGEPRFEKTGLTSFDLSFGAGSTCQSRNGCGDKTCLLNIYGLYNMHLVGAGVPDKDPDNDVDIILTDLERLPGRPCFGQLSYNGRFSIREIIFQGIQNLARGFFVQAYVPLRRLSINNITSTDLSPADPALPNINTPAWQAFLNIFPEMLAHYNLSIGPVCRQGVGDTTLLGGWTYNYQETSVLDYIDATIKCGVLLPTGQCKNENIVFDLPLGYNGHYGVPIQLQASLGSYDWLTVGAQGGAILFLQKQKTLRMKTNINQSGFIKLAEGTACVHKGALWNVGFFAKADHICRGLSLLFGYTFAQQQADHVTPTNTTVFNEAVVNSDAMFQGWRMHTINFLVDWDFTQEYMTYGPRIGFLYNLQIAGKRTFNTSIVGGDIGVDIAWRF